MDWQDFNLPSSYEMEEGLSYLNLLHSEVSRKYFSDNQTIFTPNLSTTVEPDPDTYVDVPPPKNIIRPE